jgi:hypothetical protein
MRHQVISGGSGANLISITAFVPCNGSTDYIELYGLMSSRNAEVCWRFR